MRSPKSSSAVAETRRASEKRTENMARLSFIDALLRPYYPSRQAKNHGSRPYAKTSKFGRKNFRKFSLSVLTNNSKGVTWRHEHKKLPRAGRVGQPLNSHRRNSPDASAPVVPGHRPGRGKPHRAGPAGRLWDGHTVPRLLVIR